MMDTDSNIVWQLDEKRRSAIAKKCGYMVLSIGGDFWFRLWDPITWDCVGAFEAYSGMECSGLINKTHVSFAVSSTGTQVAIPTGEKSVAIWNLLSGSVEKVFELPQCRDNSGRNAFAFSPNKSRFFWAYAGKLQNSVCVDEFDYETLNIIVHGDHCTPEEMVLLPSMNSILFHSSGQKALTLRGLGKNSLAAKNSRAALSLVLPERVIKHVSSSSCGNLLACALSNGAICVWDLRTANFKYPPYLFHKDDTELFLKMDSEVRIVEFNSRADLLLAKDKGDYTVIWDRTGQRVHSWRGNKDSVRSACFSPDGRTIITGCWDGTIRRLTYEGKELNSTLAHQLGTGGVSAVTCVSLSGNEKSSRDEIYEILTDAICCVMCADKKVTSRERKAVHKIIEKTKSPWAGDDIDKRINIFLEHAKKEGMEKMIQMTCGKLPEFKKSKKQEVLMTCLNFMARADGIVHEKEIEIINKFKSILGIESNDSTKEAAQPSPNNTSPIEKDRRKYIETGKLQRGDKSVQIKERLFAPIKSLKKLIIKETTDDRINRLWENAKKLGWSKDDCEKKIPLYTEILDLTENNSQESACLRNRGLCYKSLGNYDAAIADFARELEIHKRRGEPAIICSDLLQECRGLKRKAEAEAGDDTKSTKIREMAKLKLKLRQTGPEFETAFEKLFSYLRDENPDIRDEASRMLADSNHGLKKLVSIYEDCLNTDPRKSILAGRVLGRKIDGGKEDMIHAQTAMIMFGVQVAFTPCVCGCCGKLNVGIPVPKNGLYIGFYGQTDNKRGAYALPVLCDYCGKEFFIAWDTDPR